MAMIDFKGSLTAKGEVKTGTSKAGTPWAKQTIVVTIDGATAPYDKVAMEAFGQKVGDVEALTPGTRVSGCYSISAKEYNGRWYNDVSLYKIEAMGTTPAPAPSPQEVDDNSLELQKGDLPF